MIIKARAPYIGTDGKIVLKEIDIEKVIATEPSVIAIDGSTSNTGMAIVRKLDGALMFLLKFTRDTNGDESPVRYKVRFKRELTELLKRSTLSNEVYYEEPCIGYAGAVKNLYMLRSTVEEVIIENEPRLDYVKHYEVNNKRWKKLFLAPDKCPNNTEAEKKAVREKLLRYMPFMEGSTQDEIDATCFGITVATSLRQGLTGDSLESKAKPKPFKYEVEFMGADSDDEMLALLMDEYHGPEKILNNGIYLIDMDKRARFEPTIYKSMGQDDKLLIIKFSSDSHSNIVLEHRIGFLAAEFSYIYALVWRKYRK